MQKYRNQRKRPFPSFLKGLLGFVLLAGVALGLALLWQKSEETAAEQARMEEMAQSVASAADEGAAVSIASAPEKQPPSQDAGAGGELPAEDPAAPEGAVPASTPVSNSYFDDALFIGDSISTGIPLYHIADNAEVVAAPGLTPENALEFACIESEDGDLLTVLEAAKGSGERGKVYIMLGGNSTNTDTVSFIAAYEAFVDAVRGQYPGALIYLQSITPVVKDYQNELNPHLNNETIRVLNGEILALAERKGAYYLDVASVFRDASGNLPDDASPVDGLHFLPEYYAMWFDYLRSHTVAAGEVQS